MQMEPSDVPRMCDKLDGEGLVACGQRCASLKSRHASLQLRQQSPEDGHIPGLLFARIGADPSSSHHPINEFSLDMAVPPIVLNICLFPLLV